MADKAESDRNYNEAGRAVAAWVLDVWWPGAARIELFYGQDPGGDYEDLFPDDMQKEKMELHTLATIGYAGSIAQARVDPTLSKRIIGADDHGSLFENAETIVREHWDEIEKVVAAVADRRTLIGDDVLKLLGPPPAGPTA